MNVLTFKTNVQSTAKLFTLYYRPSFTLSKISYRTDSNVHVKPHQCETNCDVNVKVYKYETDSNVNALVLNYINTHQHICKINRILQGSRKEKL